MRNDRDAPRAMGVVRSMKNPMSKEADKGVVASNR